MSEKRFTMKYSFDDEEYVFFDGDVALTPSETVKLLNEQQAIIEEQEKVIKKQRKEYINLKENMDALRRTWAERYKHKKRRVWNY